jgi:hypothetical protein
VFAVWWLLLFSFFFFFEVRRAIDENRKYEKSKKVEKFLCQTNFLPAFCPRTLLLFYRSCSPYLIIIVIIITQRERIVPYLIPVYTILGDSA